MSIRTLLEEIEAVTEEEIANAPLNCETDGVLLKGRLTDRSVMQLATLYYRAEEACIANDFNTDPEELSPTQEHQAFLEQRRVSALAALLDYELECLYGGQISAAERMACVVLEVRADWRVFKVGDIPVQDLELALVGEKKPSRKKKRQVLN